MENVSQDLLQGEKEEVESSRRMCDEAAEDVQVFQSGSSSSSYLVPVPPAARIDNEEEGDGQDLMMDNLQVVVAPFFPADTLIEDVGLKIFELLNDEDVASCFHAYPKWQKWLVHQRTRILFPEVVPFFLKYLPKTALLECRKVCRSWKNGLDNTYQSHPQHFQVDSENWLSKDRLPELTNRLGSANEITNFLQDMESHPGNPFPGRSLFLEVGFPEGFDVETINDAIFFEDFWNNNVARDDLIDSILESCCVPYKIKRLNLYHLRGRLADAVYGFQNLEVLEVRISLRDFERFADFEQHPPLRKLALEFSCSEIIDWLQFTAFQRLCTILEVFADTLKDVKLRMISCNAEALPLSNERKGFRINLPKLERLSWANYVGPLDPFIELPSLRHLDFGFNKILHWEGSVVQLYGFEERMESSNIWSLIPSLKKLTIRWENDTGNFHKTYDRCMVKMSFWKKLEKNLRTKMGVVAATAWTLLARVVRMFVNLPSFMIRMIR